jgi:hypothetical protein
MKKLIFSVIAVLAAVAWGAVAFSTNCHDDHAVAAETGEKMEMEHAMPADTFSHHMVKDGIRGEFEVMSLASMNMTDPQGASHHIMAKFFHDEMNHQIPDMAGKVKVIGPDKKEQVAELKNYSGVFAANFTFDQRGKYGVICLVKIDGEKHVFKFWYDR